MAKYTASPFYQALVSPEKSVQFDFFGSYETTDEGEIEALNKLCPTYIKCIDVGGVKESEKNETKPEEPAQKTPTKRKPSGK
ncbi:hypothetical protein [Aneurinibacillus aneurinilyticus]|uniref:hypothetical protein n=1 Tax=Aneurinibacillus aneurinilyticus TaxID=1391 RepID=UPI0023F289E6|nr:hypothetical protein [Aneurinibacillus aneurinilyticus]